MHLNDFCHEPPRTLLILDLRRVRAGQGHLEVIRLAVKSCGCDGDQARGRLQGGSHHRHWLGTCLVEGVRYAEWCGLVRRCLGMPCPRSGFGPQRCCWRRWASWRRLGGLRGGRGRLEVPRWDRNCRETGQRWTWYNTTTLGCIPRQTNNTCRGSKSDCLCTYTNGSDICARFAPLKMQCESG